MNFLIIESLQKFHHYYGDDFKIEWPTGSSRFLTINDVAIELRRRLARLYLTGQNGLRPVLGDNQLCSTIRIFAITPCFTSIFMATPVAVWGFLTKRARRSRGNNRLA